MVWNVAMHGFLYDADGGHRHLRLHSSQEGQVVRAGDE
jgi:hypothetical protein